MKFTTEELYWIEKWAIDELNQHKEALDLEEDMENVRTYEENILDLKSILEKAKGGLR